MNNSQDDRGNTQPLPRWKKPGTAVWWCPTIDKYWKQEALREEALVEQSQVKNEKTANKVSEISVFAQETTVTEPGSPVRSKSDTTSDNASYKPRSLDMR